MLTEYLKTLAQLLPKYEEISYIFESEPEAAYILKTTTENIKQLQKIDRQLQSARNIYYFLECLADKSWERIHTGHFSVVPQRIRQIYAVANYFKIFYMLLEDLSMQQVEKCSGLLDQAVIVGCTQDLYPNNDALHEKLTQLFTEKQINLTKLLPKIESFQRQIYACDIDVAVCPTVEFFQKNFLEPQKPALLLKTIEHWPALTKWTNLNYILKVAGHRTVPVEIGANYASEEWSQQLVKLRDFLIRQFSTKTDDDDEVEIEYLAQHELFEQIPELKADIRIPDYCQTDDVNIKAWLGPKGTVSPMHYDAKHNLLCQVFGGKTIILAAPEDTPNLYAYASEFLSNTSQIDAAELDFAKFPLTRHVKFYHLKLQTGDCLYIPPKWWHYVRSESKSFSVSFWWE